MALQELNAPAVPDGVLTGEPKGIAEVLAPYRAADAAEALNKLEPALAERVLVAMPISVAAPIFNEPQLDRPARLVELMPPDRASAILASLHPDRRADIFRELPETTRASLRLRLPAPMRQTLDHLLSYPPQSAGGLMTTDFISVPADWTVAQALRHVHEVGRNRETVYTVCLLDPQTKR